MFRPICVEQGTSDPLIKGIKEIITKEMKFSGPTNPWSFSLQQTFTQVIKFLDLSCLTCSCMSVSLTVTLRKYRHNSPITNGRVIWWIQVIERMLILARIPWIVIQVTKGYNTKQIFFSVSKSVEILASLVQMSKQIEP